MNNAEIRCVRVYINDDWTFSFFLCPRVDGCGVEGAAEIRREGERMHRVVSALQSGQREDVLEALMQGCLAWRKAWKKRVQEAVTVHAGIS